MDAARRRWCADERGNTEKKGATGTPVFLSVDADDQNV